MIFRRRIGLALNTTIKKMNTHELKNTIKSFKNRPYNKEVTMDKNKYENKPELKPKYSILWRFHHGDEL
jgi:hypothetical protein